VTGTVRTKAIENRNQKQADTLHLADPMSDLRPCVAPSHIRCGFVAVGNLVSVINNLVYSIQMRSSASRQTSDAEHIENRNEVRVTVM
jgi:hypothetical protein